MAQLLLGRLDKNAKDGDEMELVLELEEADEAISEL
jgi:hypothetical protein